MTITVRYFGQLRVLTGKEEERVTCSSDTRLFFLICRLGEQYGQKFRLITLNEDTSSLRASLIILMDGQAVDKAKSVVAKETKEISLFTAIAGG